MRPVLRLRIAGKSTPDKAAIHEHAPEGLVETRIGGRRVRPERVDVALVRQSRQVIDRIAEGAQSACRTQAPTSPMCC